MYEFDFCMNLIFFRLKELKKHGFIFLQATKAQKHNFILLHD